MVMYLVEEKGRRRFTVLSLVFHLLYFIFFAYVICYLLKGREENKSQRKKEKGEKEKRKI